MVWNILLLSLDHLSQLCLLPTCPNFLPTVVVGKQKRPWPLCKPCSTIKKTPCIISTVFSQIQNIAPYQLLWRKLITPGKTHTFHPFHTIYILLRSHTIQYNSITHPHPCHSFIINNFDNFSAAPIRLLWISSTEDEVKWGHRSQLVFIRESFLNQAVMLNEIQLLLWRPDNHHWGHSIALLSVQTCSQLPGSSICFLRHKGT